MKKVKKKKVKKCVAVNLRVQIYSLTFGCSVFVLEKAGEHVMCVVQLLKEVMKKRTNL